MHQLIHQSPTDVAQRLSGLGLEINDFRIAAERGHLARANCTENDPPFIPGTIAWSMTVRTLREILLPRNWRKEDPGNYSLTISDRHGVAVVVASGDEGTGLMHLQPRTRSAKGIHTALAVQTNQGELFLDPETERQRSAIAKSGGFQTWMLLVRFEADGAWMELSLPAAMDPQGNITAWRERIILPKFDADPNLGIELPEDRGPDIEVTIRRKA